MCVLSEGAQPCGLTATALDVLLGAMPPSHVHPPLLPGMPLTSLGLKPSWELLWRRG